jgi:hypothetical protein
LSEFLSRRLFFFRSAATTAHEIDWGSEASDCVTAAGVDRGDSGNLG